MVFGRAGRRKDEVAQVPQMFPDKPKFTEVSFIFVIKFVVGEGGDACS